MNDRDENDTLMVETGLIRSGDNPVDLARIGDALRDFNYALEKAARHGLTVEIETVSHQKMGEPVRQIITAKVSRDIC